MLFSAIMGDVGSPAEDDPARKIYHIVLTKALQLKRILEGLKKETIVLKYVERVRYIKFRKIL